MNDDLLARFERLSAQAASEPLPAIDVTDRVLGTLASQSVTRLEDRDLMACGAASVLMAGLALSVVWVGYFDESLLPLAQPFLTILP